MSVLRLAPLCLAVSLACSSGGASSAYVNATALRVDPEQFTGQVECELGASADAGQPGLRSYVAELVQVTSKKNALQWSVVKRSPAVSCLQAVRFDVSDQATLGGGRLEGYAANLWGFDLEPTQVPAPQGTDVSAQLAAAAWSGSCGRGEVVVGPGDAGLVELPLDGGAIASDSGFVREFFGPQYPVPDRTVTLKGCALHAR
jgi:hypothetical protein